MSDSPECPKAREAYEKAVRASDFGKARELRNAAYKECAARDPLAKIDFALVEGEAGQERRAAVTAMRAQEVNDFMRIFLDFVAQNRQAPNRASITHRCDARAADAGVPDAGAKLADGGDAAAADDEEEEEEADEEGEDEEGDGGLDEGGRFCSSTRKVGSQQLIQVRYLENNPTIFRFTSRRESRSTAVASRARRANNGRCRRERGSRSSAGAAISQAPSPASSRW